MDKLEHVQRATARFVFADYRRTTSVTPMITKLGWDSLHVRSLLDQPAMFHKIHYQLVNISFPSFIVPASYIARHDHQLKYQIPTPSTETYKYSFCPRFIHIWNNLLPSVVLIPDTVAFKEAALPIIRGMLPLPGSNLL